jgi:hypothetical protein
MDKRTPRWLIALSLVLILVGTGSMALAARIILEPSAPSTLDDQVVAALGSYWYPAQVIVNHQPLFAVITFLLAVVLTVAGAFLFFHRAWARTAAELYFWAWLAICGLLTIYFLGLSIHSTLFAGLEPKYLVSSGLLDYLLHNLVRCVVYGGFIVVLRHRAVRGALWSAPRFN